MRGVRGEVPLTLIPIIGEAGKSRQYSVTPPKPVAQLLLRAPDLRM